MFRRYHTVHQTRHADMCELLSEVLRPVVAAGDEDDESLCVEHRACAALLAVLLNHPLDHRGRCRSCRRLGAVFGRCWRPCGAHRTAHYWLCEPNVDVLRRILAADLVGGPPRTVPDRTGGHRRKTHRTQAQDTPDTGAGHTGHRCMIDLAAALRTARTDPSSDAPTAF